MQKNKMPYLFSFSLLVTCFFSCSTPQEENTTPPSTAAKEIIRTDFQNILDTAGVTGSILIFDEQKNTYYSNNFEHAATRFIPASTFKIPNTLIALETGIMEHDSTLIKWDGSTSGIPNWDKDLLFREAFHYSCVPCYRQIARDIGVENMSKYVQLFDYGAMQFDSSNLDLFWLIGDSKISQQEQLSFLQKYKHETLPLSKRTYEIGKRLMTVERTEDYVLLAKTGRSSSQIGWYVGYAKTKNTVLYFATNIFLKTDTDTPKRQAITKAALHLWGI